MRGKARLRLQLPVLDEVLLPVPEALLGGGEWRGQVHRERQGLKFANACQCLDGVLGCKKELRASRYDIALVPEVVYPAGYTAPADAVCTVPLKDGTCLECDSCWYAGCPRFPSEEGTCFGPERDLVEMQVGFSHVI